MSQVLIASLIGALGLVGIIHALFPARLSLAAQIARTEGASRDVSRPRLADGYDALRGHVGRAVIARIGERSDVFARIAPDIAIANKSAEEIAFGSLVGAVAGLAIGPLVYMMSSAGGIGLSVALPAVASLVLGVGGACLGFFEVKAEAAKRREHFVAVTASYLEWVSMCQAGGMGIEESLVTSASICEDWALAMIRTELAAGSLRSRSPWDSLGLLGQRIGVKDLLRLRRTVKLAGTEGARVRDSVSALALAIRDREADAARRNANKVSRRVFLANVVLMTGFIALVVYPGIVGHF